MPEDLKVINDYGRSFSRLKSRTSFEANGIVKLNIGTDAAGDMYCRKTDGTVGRFGIGTEGQVLQVASGTSFQWVTLNKTLVGLSNVENVNTTNPANIVQNASYRFVTDDNITTWNGKQNALSGTGFVKISGTTISYDNTTYLIPNAAITGGTNTKITYDSKGLVTSATAATTSDIAEGTRLYYTDARVRSVVLTGYVLGANSTIVDTDSLLTAIGKIQAQLNAKAVLPSQTGNAGRFLTTDGTNLSWAIASGGGGITWNHITASQIAVVDNGYIANGATLLTLTLPATAAVGKEVSVVGKGVGGWRISQNAGQQIFYGNKSSTAGTGGYLASNHQRDTIRLVCITANTEWQVINALGTIEII